MSKNRYLAIDIGASSGRHIVGWEENGELVTREVYRFPNGVTKQDGHLIWKIEELEDHVKKGIDQALLCFPGEIRALSVDTWGVDYVLLNNDEVIPPVYAYRDHRTEAVTEEVHGIVPFKELYRHTGCQFQNFNSIYQIYADKKAGRLDGATDLLMIPEYLLYRLSGVRTREYTNATTTGLVNAKSGLFDLEIIRRLGLPERLFPALRQPGEMLGEYLGIRVMLCATHDTASAVEGIPMKENAPYISSGTWSLLGVRTEAPLTDEASCAANYSNEGGVHYNRYQKNIMGMWLANRLREELCPDRDFGLIVQEAAESTYDGLVNADDPRFLSPKSMREAFDGALTETGLPLPSVPADYFRCAYRSLAVSYGKAIRELENNTGKTYRELYIVGGGARNTFLNEQTAAQTGKEIRALPIEATALGNLRVQIRAYKAGR